MNRRELSIHSLSNKVITYFRCNHCQKYFRYKFGCEGDDETTLEEVTALILAGQLSSPFSGRSLCFKCENAWTKALADRAEPTDGW